jgi:hypothetical protein
MTDARYYSITLQNDRGSSEPGTYELKFSTGPGMSTTITDLRMGDLDALADVLSKRNSAASGEPVTAMPAEEWPNRGIQIGNGNVQSNTFG